MTYSYHAHCYSATAYISIDVLSVLPFVQCCLLPLPADLSARVVTLVCGLRMPVK